MTLHYGTEVDKKFLYSFRLLLPFLNFLHWELNGLKNKWMVFTSIGRYIFSLTFILQTVLTFNIESCISYSDSQYDVISTNIRNWNSTFCSKCSPHVFTNFFTNFFHNFFHEIESCYLHWQYIRITNKQTKFHEIIRSFKGKLSDELIKIKHLQILTTFWKSTFKGNFNFPY